MYKFFGIPRQKINSINGGILFIFDTKGEFITDDEKLIERIKPKFSHIELEYKPIGNRVNVFRQLETIKVETNEPKEAIKEPKEEAKTNIIKCKNCGESFENRGSFLAHSRKCKKEE